MRELVLFMLSFVFVYIIYQLIIVYKNKKGNELLEIKYLETVYNIDMDKVDKKVLLQTCAIISSLDIAIAVSIVSVLKGLVLEMVGCIVIVFLLVFVTYHLVYLYYKKKGMIKNGKHRKNRK